MQKSSLTRRSFLRLSMIAAGSTLAAACQKALTPVVGTNTPFASPVPSVKLNLTGGNIDAWTWVKQVQVSVTDGVCEQVLLRANGQEVQAQPEGDRFTAEVQLAEGENQITAICLQPGGGESVSE